MRSSSTGSKLDISFSDVSVIISFNNVELKSSIQLRAELNKVIVGNGSPIEVCVIRNGEKITLTLEF